VESGYLLGLALVLLLLSGYVLSWQGKGHKKSPALRPGFSVLI
jgi:hypothetical protein